MAEFYIKEMAKALEDYLLMLTQVDCMLFVLEIKCLELLQKLFNWKSVHPNRE